MIKQTIALFRYQLLGVVNIKVLLLMLCIYVSAFLAGQFVAQLAIISSDVIALGVMAEFLRYSLAFLLVINFSYQVSQDYELNQFDRLLAMPVHRASYLLAQNLVLVFFVFVLVLPVYVMMVFISETSLAWYWAISVFLELLLIGQFALLAILSLEKLPVAVILTFAVYLLARSAPLLDMMFLQSVEYYEDESGFQLGYFVFSAIRYLLPDAAAFAQNNVIFNSPESSGLIAAQLLTVIIYGVFIQLVTLIDFYRKEFNQS